MSEGVIRYLLTRLGGARRGVAGRGKARQGFLISNERRRDKIFTDAAGRGVAWQG